MTSRNRPQSEIDELRELIAEERKRIRAKRDLIDATTDATEYRAAFKRFLEVLPHDSPLIVTSSFPKHKRH